MAYSGQIHWRSRVGDEIAARLGEPLTKDLTAQRFRTALFRRQRAWWACRSSWERPTVVATRYADTSPMRVDLSLRTMESARAYAALLARISGEKPTLVLSDEKAASRRIARFAPSSQCPLDGGRADGQRGRRRPAVGRGRLCDDDRDAVVLRGRPSVGSCEARRRGETASVFLPSVLPLLTLAAATSSSSATTPSDDRSATRMRHLRPPSRTCWMRAAETETTPDVDLPG